ncbi:MAG: SurA N-terminal domain-containing protein [Dehalococcoidia bacterium]|nr:SurA N-terminal domain-containing protein [Dehalococcoidia bacterium]
MAKAKTRQVLRADERARRAREANADRWNRQLIIGAVVLVVLVAIGFIAFGWYQTQIKPLGKTVLQVGDTEFSLAHLERRMRLEQKENPSFAQGELVLQLPDQILANFEREGTILEGAEQLDVSVTQEEIAAEIRTRAGLAEDVAPSDFSAALKRLVEESGLKLGEYQQMVKGALLEDKVRGYFAYLAPKEEPQVRARWIVVRTQEEADQVVARLEGGEDFGEIARDVSVHEATAQAGGELGWVPRGSSSLVPSVESFLFDAEPGAHSEVLSEFDQFFIAELEEKADSRELDGDQRAQVAAREMNEWLAATSATLGIERTLSDDDRAKALADVL